MSSRLGTTLLIVALFAIGVALSRALHAMGLPINDLIPADYEWPAFLLGGTLLASMGLATWFLGRFTQHHRHRIAA